ncbi:hypothetical protein NQF87_05675 [Bombella sp. TMW 2.2559]|uniref:DUF2442 domain-containing protein n=1 Tax=Bombella dulcis TaxID=2967339 RepID=A0ABT3WBL0_9PROT|nr:hypothetical protein [Bombella dulcis]MCX5616461.1 hypothetical protein [Bombella dulcis]
MTDPDLTVTCLSGQDLPLVWKTGQRYLFRLTDGCDEVLLSSRVSRPCDVIGPFVDDRRWLGVPVGRVQLFWGDGTREDVTGFLSAPREDGWDVQEASPSRFSSPSSCWRVDLTSVTLILLLMRAGSGWKAAWSELVIPDGHGGQAMPVWPYQEGDGHSGHGMMVCEGGAGSWHRAEPYW